MIIAPLKPWWKHWDCIALFLFVFSTMFLYGYGQQRFFGLLMIGAFILCRGKSSSSHFASLRPIPPELVCYTAWVVWGLVTGLVAAVDMDRYQRIARVLVQVFIMVWAVYGILRSRRETGVIDAVFLAIIAGGVAQIVKVALGMQHVTALLDGDRVAGATLNPNTLGFAMAWTSISALYFWNTPAHRLQLLKKSFILILLGACAFVMLATASRKSALAFIVLAVCWVVFVMDVQTSLWGLLQRAFLTAGMLALLSVIVPWVTENSLLGSRFASFAETGKGSLQASIEEQPRFWFYVQGWNMFKEQPVLGVGLGNFEDHAEDGRSSHSNYIEPLATTGLPGFLLFQAVYALILIRAFKLLRVVQDSLVRYRLKIVLLGLVVVLFLGLGAAWWEGTMVNVLVAAFMTYTWGLERDFLFARRRPTTRLAPPQNKRMPACQG